MYNIYARICESVCIYAMELQAIHSFVKDSRASSFEECLKAALFLPSLKNTIAMRADFTMEFILIIYYSRSLCAYVELN